MTGPGDRWLYHFTHLDNLAAIRSAGCLHCDARARAAMTRTEVGSQDIKESRRKRAIPISPGGFVGEYVPFYFASRSPMMYRIACDHRDSVPGRYQGGDTPLIYLVTSVAAVVRAGLTWVATDGNAATATTEFTSDLSAWWRWWTGASWRPSAGTTLRTTRTGSAAGRPSSSSTVRCRWNSSAG